MDRWLLRLRQQLVESRDSYLRYPAIVLARIGFSATLLNLVGMVMGLLVALAIIFKAVGMTFTFLSLSALADVLDGPLARETKTASRWGAVLDASCDRTVDLSIYSALLIRSTLDRNYFRAFLAWLNLVVDTLRSYTRARAEASLVGQNLDFKLGILPRAGKIVLLLLGFGHPSFLTSCLLASAVLSIVTVCQRLHAAYQQYQLQKGLE